MKQKLKFTLCIPAGGSGSRLASETPKQYLPLLGIPMIVHTLRAFDGFESCERIIIAANDVEKLHAVLNTYPLVQVPLIVRGGETRAHSVMHCLDAIEEDTIVLIHDAARPCVTRGEIESVLAAMQTHDAAVLALPARDTVKRVSEERFVRETIPRAEISLAQTPQAARASILRPAYRETIDAAIEVTDDVQVLERKKIPVAVVEGLPTNIKVTTPDDLIVAEAILRARQEAVR